MGPDVARTAVQAAYTGVTGALIVVSADDPGMARARTKQERAYRSAGLPMLDVDPRRL